MASGSHGHTLGRQPPRGQADNPPGPNIPPPDTQGNITRAENPSFVANTSQDSGQSDGTTPSLTPSAEFRILGLDGDVSAENSREGDDSHNQSGDGMSEGIFDTEATENYPDDEDLTSVIEHLQSPLQSPVPGLQRVTPLNSMSTATSEPKPYVRLGPPIAGPSEPARAEVSRTHYVGDPFDQVSTQGDIGEYAGLEPGLDPFLSSTEAVASGSSVRNPERSPHRRNRSPHRASPDDVARLPQLPPVPNNIIVFGKPREVILPIDQRHSTVENAPPVQLGSSAPTGPTGPVPAENDRHPSGGSRHSQTSQNSHHSTLNDSMRQTCKYPPSALKQPPKRTLMTEGPNRPLLAGIPPVPAFPAPSVIIDNEKYDQWGRKQCSLTLAILLLFAFIGFPPFWLLLGAGIFDSCVGAVPRRVKQVALILGAGALAAATALSIVFCLV